MTRVPLMNIQIRLKESDKQIDDKILDALYKEVNKMNWKVIGTEILELSRDILGGMLRVQPEYTSLLNGKLRSELGLEDVSVVEQIIGTWISGITVTTTRIQRRNGQLIGKIILQGLPKDLHDVAHLGTYKTEKGSEIKWLDWLMNLGDNIIITTHTIGFHKESSRTDGAVMVKSERGWSVPSEYSGTSNNNYVTRAVDASLPMLSTEIEKLVKRKI